MRDLDEGEEERRQRGEGRAAAVCFDNGNTIGEVDVIAGTVWARVPKGEGDKGRVLRKKSRGLRGYLTLGRGAAATAAGHIDSFRSALAIRYRSRRLSFGPFPPLPFTYLS